MHYTHIRNATGLLDYAGERFLIDPMFAEKGAHPPLMEMANSQCRNPLTALPLAVGDILQKADKILLTHAHPDHWDKTASDLIPKDFPIYVQNQADFDLLRGQHFTNLTILQPTDKIGAVTLHKINGQHGGAEIYGDPALASLLGTSSGFVFQAAGEPVLYLMGDTIWTKEVMETLQKFQPEIALLNAGFGLTLHHGPMIMGTEDLLRVHRFSPKTNMVAVHLEAVSPCILSRGDIRAFAEKHGISQKVFVPEDGETLSFPLKNS